MKLLFAAVMCFFSGAIAAQDYEFPQDFTVGTIILKNATRRVGYLKWFPAQEEKVIFKENEDAAKEKFSPEELRAFIVDTVKFVSLSNFEVFGSDYVLLGNLSKIKHTFGQLLDSGSFNIYFVQFRSYNAISGSVDSYPNFVFERKTDSGYRYAAFPYAIRMRDKKYESAKENLYVFFRDYPEITDRIKAYKQQDNFLDIIKLMKNSN